MCAVGRRAVVLTNRCRCLRRHPLRRCRRPRSWSVVVRPPCLPGRLYFARASPALTRFSPGHLCLSRHRRWIGAPGRRARPGSRRTRQWNRARSPNTGVDRVLVDHTSVVGEHHFASMASPEADLLPSAFPLAGARRKRRRTTTTIQRRTTKTTTTIRDNGSRQLPHTVFTKVLAPYLNGIAVRDMVPSCPVVPRSL